MDAAVRTPNRLIDQKSPYLLQHAYNPVDWYPWDEEAFAKAREEEKPVFLSIGYSTCHWCHVMERESFEDAEVAAVLNDHFVAIKVDREERPDVDHVYMEVCQALTGRGGWPLTVLLTPEKQPFFAGTYFPKLSRGGHLGLLDLLQRVAEGWDTERRRFREAGEEVTRHLTAVRPPAQAGELGVETLAEAYAELESTFDPVHGGFGPAPKFPLPHQLVFLLRYADRTGQPHAQEMALTTLAAMRRGGLWDHLGFGFARYSTDRRWLVPHFEKMLYDNALLAMAYLEASQATGERFWGAVAADIFTYVLREMTSPEGAFYSAQDADSEGVEGKFYVWTPVEVEAVLGEEPGRLFARVFDITPEGNFEGKCIPNLIERNISDWSGTLGLPEAELSVRLEAGRERLRAARDARVHPHKDDKVLTAWNGLMIAALAKGAAVLDRPDLAAAAEKAAAFLEEHLRRSDGRLLARYRDGEAAFPAYLDDYAFLAWGYVELYQATLRPAHLRGALRLVDELLALFWDEEGGGCFFTGRDAEELFARPKEVYDGALPSGNSVLALVLQRLAHLTGSDRLADLADRQVEAFAGPVAGHPTAHTLFLSAVDWAVGPATEVIVAGSRDDASTESLLKVVQRRYLPRTTLLFRPPGGAAGEIEALAPAAAGHEPAEGRATAWVCRERACQPPVQTPEALGELLVYTGLHSTT